MIYVEGTSHRGHWHQVGGSHYCCWSFKGLEHEGRRLVDDGLHPRYDWEWRAEGPTPTKLRLFFFLALCLLLQEQPWYCQAESKSGGPSLSWTSVHCCSQDGKRVEGSLWKGDFLDFPPQFADKTHLTAPGQKPFFCPGWVEGGLSLLITLPFPPPSVVALALAKRRESAAQLCFVIIHGTGFRDLWKTRSPWWWQVLGY